MTPRPTTPEASPATLLFTWAAPALLAGTALSLLPGAQDNPVGAAGRAALLAAVSFAGLHVSRSVTGRLALSLILSVTVAAAALRVSDAPLVWALCGALSAPVSLALRRAGVPSSAALTVFGALLIGAQVGAPQGDAALSVGLAALFTGTLLLVRGSHVGAAVTGVALAGAALCGSVLYAGMLGGHVNGLLIGALVSVAVVTVMAMTPQRIPTRT